MNECLPYQWGEKMQFGEVWRLSAKPNGLSDEVFGLVDFILHDQSPCNDGVSSRELIGNDPVFFQHLSPHFEASLTHLKGHLWLMDTHGNLSPRFILLSQ